jgi:hypothetical protein
MFTSEHRSSSRQDIVTDPAGLDLNSQTTAENHSRVLHLWSLLRAHFAGPIHPGSEQKKKMEAYRGRPSRGLPR